MGNGDKVKTSGVCRGLCLQLAEIEVMAEFFPLKLGTSDVVLGFQWLATLGDSVMNWGNLCLQVTHFRRGKGQDPRRPGFIQISSILEQFGSYTKT